MSRPKTSINEELIEKAESELKGATGKEKIKLMAIIAYKDKGIVEVSKLFKISINHFFKILKRYKAAGIEGLKDKAKGHKRAKLNNEQLEEIKYWIVNSETKEHKRVHWTLEKLREEIIENYSVEISLVGIWQYLKKMHLGLRVPRPRHNKADKEKQEEFKKKPEKQLLNY